MDLLFSFVLLMLPILGLVTFKYVNSPSSKNCKPLPPGPKPWPIIGNLLDVSAKNPPHVTFSQLTKVYGPVISLRMGSKLVIVGSSPEFADEILKTHDRVFSGRPLANALPFDSKLAFAPTCHEDWNFLRTMLKTNLFSERALELQANLRKKKATEMVHFLASKQGQVVNVGEVVFSVLVNTLTNIFFSKDLFALEDQKESRRILDLISRHIAVGATPNISDFYPILAGFDVQGLLKEGKKRMTELSDVWKPIIKERRQALGGNNPHSDREQDFLDVLFANNLSDDQISNFIIDLFPAGTDATLSTIEWLMPELIMNKEAMEKLGDELNREIKGNSIVESQVCELPYLKACLNEIFRLHHPVPLLLPHRAQETCEVLGYTIPKDADVIINAWAIGRDPKVWNDPLSFKPERFLDSHFDYKGHDCKFLPFGSGRRSCPGLPLAARQAHLMVASLIHFFDWCFPNSEEAANFEMNGKYSITSHKEAPSLVVPKVKRSIG